MFCEPIRCGCVIVLSYHSNLFIAHEYIFLVLSLHLAATYRRSVNVAFKKRKALFNVWEYERNCGLSVGCSFYFFLYLAAFVVL